MTGLFLRSVLISFRPFGMTYVVLRSFFVSLKDPGVLVFFDVGHSIYY